VVADADPRNAIAMVGLAQVALGRDDVAGARGLATRALEIDPDEAAAARLLAELDGAAAPPASSAAPAPSRTSSPRPAAGSTKTWWRRWLDRLRRPL
ncbi:MAG TPA: hypothetical protein VGM49_02895, partial [Candidatus Limnocylindrales bacterium]